MDAKYSHSSTFSQFRIYRSIRRFCCCFYKNGWFVGEQATVPDELLEPSKRGLTIAENETLYGEKIVDERVTLIIHPIEFVEGFKLVQLTSNLS